MSVDSKRKRNYVRERKVWQRKNRKFQINRKHPLILTSLLVLGRMKFPLKWSKFEWTLYSNSIFQRVSFCVLSTIKIKLKCSCSPTWPLWRTQTIHNIVWNLSKYLKVRKFCGIYFRVIDPFWRNWIPWNTAKK